MGRHRINWFFLAHSFSWHWITEGAGQMTQCKAWTCKFRSIALTKRLSLAACACDHNTRAERQWIPGTCWPASLAEAACSWFWERLSETHGGEAIQEDSWHHLLVSLYMPIQINASTHTSEASLKNHLKGLISRVLIFLQHIHQNHSLLHKYMQLLVIINTLMSTLLKLFLEHHGIHPREWGENICKHLTLNNTHNEKASGILYEPRQCIVW